MSVSVPILYNVVKQPLDTAETDKRYRIPGTYLEFATDGSLTGILIRIGSKLADSKPIDLYKSHKLPAKFKEFYVTWPAQSGKTLYIFIGRDGSESRRV